MSHPDRGAAVTWIALLLEDHLGFTHVELTGSNPTSPPHQVTVTLARYADVPDGDEDVLTLGIAREGDTAYQVWQILAGPDAGLWASISVDRHGVLLPDSHQEDEDEDLGSGTTGCAD